MLRQKEKHFKEYIALSLEQLVPANNFYRQVEAKLDLSFVRELVKDRYVSNKGRPAIDPVVFFKLQLIMFFEGIRSERQLMETANLNVAHRWYLGYDFDEAVPHHSSLSKIRDRYGLGVFQRFFERVVELCIQAGLVWGKELYFDGTKVRANADMDSLVPRWYQEAKQHVERLFADETPGPAGASAPPAAPPTEATTETVYSPAVAVVAEPPAPPVLAPPADQVVAPTPAPSSGPLVPPVLAPPDSQVAASLPAVPGEQVIGAMMSPDDSGTPELAAPAPAAPAPPPPLQLVARASAQAETVSGAAEAGPLGPANLVAKYDGQRPPERRSSYERVTDAWVSTTDPDAAPMSRYTGDRAKLGYHTQYVVDGGRARIILAALVTPASVMDNSPMLDLARWVRFRWRLKPRIAVGDAAYGTVANIVGLAQDGIKAYAPSHDRRARPAFYGADRFVYDAQNDCYTCPMGQTLPFVHQRHTEGVLAYRAETAVCQACPVRTECTESQQGRLLLRSVHQETLDQAAADRQTEAYRKALRKRAVWVEPLFGEGKQWHGMRRFRLRQLDKVNMEGLMRAAGQNLKRFLKAKRRGKPSLAVAATAPRSLQTDAVRLGRPPLPRGRSRSGWAWQPAFLSRAAGR